MLADLVILCELFSGELVSLDCENRLLELTGYYGEQHSADAGESVSEKHMQVKTRLRSQARQCWDLLRVYSMLYFCDDRSEILYM
jgi:hypothetical protein